MAGAEGAGMQQLQQRCRAEPGQDPDQAPAQDASDAAQRHQPERPQAGDEPAAEPEQHNLGNDPFGPEGPDHPVGKAELAPIEGAEAVIELVARLQCRGADHEQPEAAVAGKPGQRRPARSPATRDRSRRDRQTGKEQHRRGEQHQQQDLVSGQRRRRRITEQPAARHRRQDEADRAPDPHPAVIEALAAHRRQGDAVAQRHQRRLRDPGD